MQTNFCSSVSILFILLMHIANAYLDTPPSHPPPETRIMPLHLSNSPGTKNLIMNGLLYFNHKIKASRVHELKPLYKLTREKGQEGNLIQSKKNIEFPSSLPSPQSFSPSHFQVIGIHRPLVQRNWLSSQVTLRQPVSSVIEYISHIFIYWFWLKWKILIGLCQF